MPVRDPSVPTAPGAPAPSGGVPVFTDRSGMGGAWSAGRAMSMPDGVALATRRA